VVNRAVVLSLYVQSSDSSGCFTLHPQHLFIPLSNRNNSCSHVVIKTYNLSPVQLIILFRENIRTNRNIKKKLNITWKIIWVDQVYVPLRKGIHRLERHVDVTISTKEHMYLWSQLHMLHKLSAYNKFVC